MVMAAMCFTLPDSFKNSFSGKMKGKSKPAKIQGVPNIWSDTGDLSWQNARQALRHQRGIVRSLNLVTEKPSNFIPKQHFRWLETGGRHQCAWNQRASWIGTGGCRLQASTEKFVVHIQNKAFFVLARFSLVHTWTSQCPGTLQLLSPMWGWIKTNPHFIVHNAAAWSTRATRIDTTGRGQSSKFGAQSSGYTMHTSSENAFLRAFLNQTISSTRWTKFAQLFRVWS